MILLYLIVDLQIDPEKLLIKIKKYKCILLDLLFKESFK